MRLSLTFLEILPPCTVCKTECYRLMIFNVSSLNSSTRFLAETFGSHRAFAAKTFPCASRFPPVFTTNFLFLDRSLAFSALNLSKIEIISFSPCRLSSLSQFNYFKSQLLQRLCLKLLSCHHVAFWALNSIGIMDCFTKRGNCWINKV